jgi:uncharacterized protein
MAKHFFKRILPHPAQLKSHPRLQFLGKLLDEPNLWHLNRRSLAGGMAVGLFVAFMPLPLQMLWAAILAVFFRVNIPLSISLVWITNPLTIPPMFYAAYWIGNEILSLFGFMEAQATQQAIDMLQQGWDWSDTEYLLHKLKYVWKPLILGLLILGAAFSAIGYYGVHFIWRRNVMRSWDKRRKLRADRK